MTITVTKIKKTQSFILPFQTENFAQGGLQKQRYITFKIAQVQKKTTVIILYGSIKSLPMPLCL